MDSKTKRFIRQITGDSSDFKTAASSRVLWLETKPAGVPDLCLSCAQAGGIFDSGFAYSHRRSKEWIAAYVFRVPSIGKLIVIWSQASRFHSVSEKLPAAAWDERKMAEKTGAEFIGLPDQRPIMMHPENSRLTANSTARANRGHNEYSFSGTGAEGEFEIPVGPVHAGIIEPGHFRFHVSGEDINKLEVRLSYLHKGIEKTAQGKRMDGLFPLVEQVSGDESVANSVAYAQAVESLEGIEIPKRAESLRLVLLELERICSHLADLGGMAMDVGYYTSSAQFLSLREDLMRLNEKTSGNRFLRNLVCVGGLSKDIPSESLEEINSELEVFSRSLSEAEKFTLNSSTFLDRVFTTGRISKETTVRLSIVGPAARASGISCDTRKYFPYGAYKKNSIRESLAGSGDVLSRFNVKRHEIKESVRLIGIEIGRMPKGAVTARNLRFQAPEGAVGIGMCEAPRGSCTFLVQAGRKGTVESISIRTASFRNWRALERAVLLNIIADFPLINKSFNLSYSGADL